MKNKFTLTLFAFALFSFSASAQQLVKDIYPGSYGSIPNNLVPYNGLVYFAADTSTSSSKKLQLWKSDGTTAGTIPLSTSWLNASGGFDKKAGANGYLFFGAYDPIAGFELHKSDGTFAGTSLVKDIRVGAAGSQLIGLFAFNGNVYFSVEDGVNGRELWKSDGTSAGTIMVKDIRPGQYGSITTSGSSSSDFAILNNELYFAAWDGISPSGAAELWKTDGTSAGTVKVKPSGNGDFARFPTGLITFNGRVYFSARSVPASGSSLEGEELYVSDGTDGGTLLVKDINPSLYIGSFPLKFTIANNLLFFCADDGIHGRELWKTDGTTGGTNLVKDIYTGATTSGAISSTGGIENDMVGSNNLVFFAAYEPSGGTELWKSDGTAAGTVMVKDIFPGTTNSDPQSLCDVGGKLFFRAKNSLGTELWKSDGTTSGTTLVSDIASGSSSSTPIWLINMNGTLFFQADNGISGRELWKYTTSVIGINETSNSASLINIYPNPSNGLIAIENKNGQPNTSYFIINSLGQEVLVGKLIGEKTSVDINHLLSGIYLIQVGEEKTQSFKLIKK